MQMTPVSPAGRRRRWVVVIRQGIFGCCSDWGVRTSKCMYLTRFRRAEARELRNYECEFPRTIRFWTARKSRPTKTCFSSFLFLAQFRQNAEIFQRRCILRRRFAAGDVAQQSAHDFAGAGFWQRLCEADIVG